MKSVLIVEDNSVMAENLGELVKMANGAVTIYYAENSAKAYAIAMEKSIDLMLVDVVLDTAKPGDVSGMKFAENIRTVSKYKFVPIIMVTSLEDPKLYAYSEVHCYSYIEKPYDSNKAKKVIREALQYRNGNKKNKRYMYKKDGIFYSINLEEVILAENRNRMLHIYTLNEKIEVPYISMGKLLEQFENDDFVQCSRNCIINKAYIEHIDVTNRCVKMKGMSHQIDIGATMKKQFLANVNAWS